MTLKETGFSFGQASQRPGRLRDPSVSIFRDLKVKDVEDEQGGYNQHPNDRQPELEGLFGPADHPGIPVIVPAAQVTAVDHEDRVQDHHDNQNN